MTFSVKGYRLFALLLACALALTALGAVPEAAHAQDQCGTAPAPRLSVGGQARVVVSDGTGNNLRATANTTATVMGVLADGEVFSVVSGPQCAEGYWWWQVRRTSGQEGWTAEGLSGQYWIEPWPAAPGTPLSTGDKPVLPGVQLAYYSGQETLMVPHLMEADGSQPRVLAQLKAFDSRLVWSPDGQWIAFSDGSDLHIVARDGSLLTNLTNSPGVTEYWPAWSPDSQRIAYVSQAGEDTEIHMRPINGLNAVNLTNNPAHDGWPAWSPDGTQIVFASDRGGDMDLYTMSASDGSGVEQVTQGPTDDTQPAWSPDGMNLAYLAADDDFVNLMVIQPPFSATVVMTENNVSEFAWSPDSARIAYSAETPLQSGQYELFSTRADVLEPLQFTVFGARLAGLSWSPDGEWLAFASNSTGTFEIYVVRSGGFGLARLTENTLLDTFPTFMPPSASAVVTPGATPGTGATPQPAATANPAEQDLLLIYDAGVPVFTLQNVSGMTLNLEPLSFQGAGRTVPATVWSSLVPPASPMSAFQGNGCVMIWPYGIADQPAPAECGTARQAWVVDSDLIFWNAGTFTVTYNDAVVATCDAAALSCAVDLP